MSLIKIAETDQEVRACFSVLSQLRENLDGTALVAKVRSAPDDGYRLVFLALDPNKDDDIDEKASTFDSSQHVVVAVAGFVVRESWAFGRHLYVLDLVTHPAHRSKGYGAQLLTWLQTHAREERSCTRLLLDSGLARRDAHRFYEREGLRKVCYLFMGSVNVENQAFSTGTNERRLDLFHYLTRFSPTTHYILLLIITFAIMGCLAVLDQPLKNEVAPHGIVSFELAGTMDEAERILSSWDDNAKIYAGISLGLDYLFLVVYPLAIGFACRWAAGKTANPHWRRIGIVIGSVQVVAGVLDAVENCALIQLLLDSSWSVCPLIARPYALVKFAIVVLGIVYASATLLATLCRKPKTD